MYKGLITFLTILPGYSQCLPGSGGATTKTTTKATTSTTKAATTSTPKASTSTTKAVTTTKTTAATTKTVTTTQPPTSTATGSVSLNGLTGYAAGTTGGNGGSVVTVTNAAALTAALLGDAPKIVKISGIIDISGLQINIGPNTSVLGVGSNSGVIGGGLRVKKASNVVIRNLKFSFSLAPIDSLVIEASTKVWVDHCEFFSDMNHDKDYYDGLLDINHGSDFVTLSWNKFHDHYKVNLVGHSDNNAAEDTGKLHVTYHHNHFYNLYSRVPSLRFGSAHLYNNYYSNVSGSCIHTRMGANALVEYNVFSNSIMPIETTGDSKIDGFVNQRK